MNPATQLDRWDFHPEKLQSESFAVGLIIEEPIGVFVAKKSDLKTLKTTEEKEEEATQSYK